MSEPEKNDLLNRAIFLARIATTRAASKLAEAINQALAKIPGAYESLKRIYDQVFSELPKAAQALII